MTDPNTAATAAIKWLWEKYGKDLLSKGAEVARQQWSHLRWDELEERYRRRLIEQHSTTKLLGNPKEIDLDSIYTDVYVFDQVTAFRRLDTEDLKQKQFSRTDETELLVRYPLLQIAETQHRLFVLGKPGAGKSTFLKKVTRLCCNGQLQKTPIFVPLKRWSDSKKTIKDFIISEFEVCEFPDAGAFLDQLLESGAAVVLFDGLDEVPNTEFRRREAIDALTEFSRRYRRSKIILTCRTAATEYSFEKFTYVQVADFVKEQQDEFIAKWYSERPDTLNRFLKQWNTEDSAGLKDLAKTPLLLALLCLAYDSTLSFPRRRVELYEEAVNALLRKWDASREVPRDDIYRWLSHGRKEQMLRRIAFESFVNAEILMPKKRIVKLVEDYLQELPPDDIRREIDGVAIVRAMEAQHGLIVERAYDIFSFSHLTVHEYFVARKVVDSTKNEEVVELVRLHATDDQWREVILMVASILDDGRFLVDALVTVLREFPSKNKNIGRFIDDLLNARHANKVRRYGSSKSMRAEKLVGGSQDSILECCVTIAGNMKLLDLEDRHISVPRIIASGLRVDPDAIQRNFQSNPEQMRTLQAYFRLAALISDCLTVATLPNRASYLQRLFEKPNALLPN